MMATNTDIVPLILFIFLVLLIVSVIWSVNSGAPWLPTSMKQVHRMLSIAEAGPEDVVYDLGCGDGKVTLLLKEVFRPTELRGFDINPRLVKRAGKKGIKAEVKNLDEEMPQGELAVVWDLCLT